jgi:hypothetical protein
MRVRSRRRKIAGNRRVRHQDFRCYFLCFDTLKYRPPMGYRSFSLLEELWKNAANWRQLV